ncbi:MAG: homoserine O-succinyltransferase [Saprospiraceae bacterium]|jgi:homoserine O-succinyltransferase/O-acetyltransferase|nr:homoserine O-succinyltransferase [Saprospiraceae bacterium]MDP4821310.1 homoserine O-succinyltransferase [Saprospiraceae bacterium]MDP4998161.1 homoserine O-succinyltransferase [Saprospiraceae bacterium]
MAKFKAAILDLYDNTPNQGMRCIHDILSAFKSKIEWDVFDVRGAANVPDLSYDIYISTGGPGSPYDGDGIWDKKYYEWLDACWNWNQESDNSKKYVFFICHSFQMAVIHFQLAQVVKRKTKSFGIFPVHPTPAGKKEPLFNGLPHPFWVADFRDWQVIQPDYNKLQAMGAEILAIEKIRPHIPLERAIMGIRFSKEMIALQFHPEADPDGMLVHFLEPERRKVVIENHSEAKYLEMIDGLNDATKIRLTHEIVLPLFLHRSLTALETTLVMA